MTTSPDIVQIKGELLTVSVDMRPGKRHMNAFLARFAEARRKAMETGAKAGLAVLKRLTPQKYSKALAQNWDFTISGNLRSETLRFWNRVLNLRRGGGKLSGQALLDILTSGTKRHAIRPDNKYALNAPGAATRFRQGFTVASVMHPGIKKNPFIQRALRETEEAVRKALAVEVKKL